MNVRQHGVALISVLLIMSLALLITAGMLRNHRLVLQSSAQQLHQVQLRQLGFAGEAWAMQLLRNPELDEQKTVNLAQEWARSKPPFEVEDGDIRVNIEDLAARFNLNTLFKEGQIDQITLGRWSRLLERLQIKNLDLSALQSSSPAGGLTDLSQLRLLSGIDGEVLRRLQPWVALLPRDASLNINTAPAQLLMTLEGMTPAVAEAVVSQRPAQGYRSAQAFTEEPLLSGLSLSSHGLGVSSRWFRITVEVALGQSHLRLVTDVERDLKSHRLSILQRRLLAPLKKESSR
jgi:general secretion pathway protein K